MPYYHWGRVTLIWDVGTLPPWMHRWLALTIGITTLLFTYPQVCKYGSFRFVTRRLAMRIRNASALTPRRLSTEVTKGLNC